MTDEEAVFKFKKPESCWQCPLIEPKGDFTTVCLAIGAYLTRDEKGAEQARKKRHPDCPLIISKVEKPKEAI